MNHHERTAAAVQRAVDALANYVVAERGGAPDVWLQVAEDDARREMQRAHDIDAAGS